MLLFSPQTRLMRHGIHLSLQHWKQNYFPVLTSPRFLGWGGRGVGGDCTWRVPLTTQEKIFRLLQFFIIFVWHAIAIMSNCPHTSDSFNWQEGFFFYSNFEVFLSKYSYWKIKLFLSCCGLRILSQFHQVSWIPHAVNPTGLILNNNVKNVVYSNKHVKKFL